ncbi:4-carboxymuconolactone decarboxylase [Ochrobactrum intermedium]|uniref:4-carboxymuconolactone decarboxylase n=1 Tax=Brucella intermedia TaxID=94625 RepID=A0ABR6AVJ0_9HYPH|nr:carboxymuconolactone decarboxylase family protein [Brucella intermedia]MBA8853480.1 4-carboxymuconolactone decarboxylase [Brucella intermedia]
MSKHQDEFDAGLNLRRDMFGPAGAEQAVAAASEFAMPLQEIVTEFCFGNIWQREGLDRRTRSMLTVALLIGSGRTAQLPMHFRGAIANGVTKDELREIILHSMLYVGIPASVEATAICEKTLGG